MDAHLEAIQSDGLGPTIHARNLFQLSAGMYDAWTCYHKEADHYFLGKDFGTHHFEFDGFVLPKGQNSDSAIEVTIHYLSFSLISKRFGEYSSKTRMMDRILEIADSVGINQQFRNLDYGTGSAAALGNFIADQIYTFALTESAGDMSGYEGQNYEPFNEPLKPNYPGGQGIRDPNRWQPLAVLEYTEKRGWNPNLKAWNRLLVNNEDIFLTPHWGEQTPFAMDERDKKIMERDGQPFTVYNDPGMPPQTGWNEAHTKAYQWNFALVSVWSNHNDPNDSTMIDISPRSMGHTRGILPQSYEEYYNFFDLKNGGTKNKPYKVNPYTKKPYAPNMVRRGDYTRVIAEYWVDGVNTYTPPGHWVKTFNAVSDHPELEKKWRGKGKELSAIEWEVKGYFALTGALHDAGISAWSVKAYYDYVRPISAIRWMADLGQSTDSLLPNFHIQGLPLIPELIEIVEENDPLSGEEGQHVGKIKLHTWRGPDYVADPATDRAHTGWILAENWWPYQQYSFATPPFAGYISGHSAFSTAAAEMLTYITGSPFFPGGICEKTFKKGDFLMFEEGPSEDITLQWATYREASDETCLSRIWGGIHPPVDDIKGRIIGERIAEKAIEFATKHYQGKVK